MTWTNLFKYTTEQDITTSLQHFSELPKLYAEKTMEARDKNKDELARIEQEIGGIYFVTEANVNNAMVPAPTKTDPDKTKPAYSNVAARKAELESRLLANEEYQSLLQNRELLKSEKIQCWEDAKALRMQEKYFTSYFAFCNKLMDADNMVEKAEVLRKYQVEDAMSMFSTDNR